MWLGVWRGGLDKLLSRKAEVESESDGVDGAGWLEAGGRIDMYYEMRLWILLFLLNTCEEKGLARGQIYSVFDVDCIWYGSLVTAK